MTPLDRAHLAMTADPDDPEARLAFHEVLAGSELLVLIQDGEGERPALFATSDGQLALAFDREDRLAAFSEGAAAQFAAMPGRLLVSLLAGRGIGIGLNLGVAPSSWLVPAEAVDWLSRALDQPIRPVDGQPLTLAAPETLSPALLQALDRRLARAAGLAQRAVLARAVWPDRSGLLLAVIGARREAEPALAQALGEVLTLFAAEGAVQDVAFVAAGSDLARRLARVGVTLEVPPAEAPPAVDPAMPPRLR